MKVASLGSAVVMALAVSAGLAVLVAAGSPPGDSDDNKFVAEARPETPIISATPLVIQVQPPAALRTQMERVSAGESSWTIRLTVAGVKPGGETAGVRVFFNPAGNGDVESTKSAHYVGTFSFYGASEKNETGDYSLDLGTVLRKLRQAGQLDLAKPLTVALQVTPLRPSQDVSAAKIPFAKIVIEAVKPADQNR